MPAVPLPGRQLDREIARRRRLLPPALRNDPAYAADSPHWEQWLKDEHEDRRHSYFAPAPRAVQSAYPALPDPLWFDEEVPEDDDDPEMQAAYEASNRTLVEDEIKRWEKVRTVAAALMPPPPLQQQEYDPDEVEPWHYAMEREQEQEQDLPPPPPLPTGLVGQSWVFTGGSWEVPPEQEQEAPPQQQAPPEHLWTPPPFYILDD